MRPFWRGLVLGIGVTGVLGLSHILMEDTWPQWIYDLGYSPIAPVALILIHATWMELRRTKEKQ